MIRRDSIRHAMSDLVHRKGTAALIATTIFCAALSVLLLAYYGVGIQAHLHDSLDSKLLTRVAVDSPPGGGSETRFSDERLADVAAAPGVEGAWSRMEVVVDVSTAGGRVAGVVVEGVDPADPIVGTDMLLWGPGLHSSGDREVVLTESRLARLGGKLGPSGPSFSTISVEAAREVARSVEKTVVHLTIVGVIDDAQVDGRAGEHLYVSSGVAMELDHWLTGRRSSLPWEDSARRGRVEFTGARIYVRERSQSLLDADMEALRVTANPEGEVTTVTFDGSAWIGLEAPERFVGRPDWSSLRGLPIRWASLVELQVPAGTVQCVGLEPGDPRWGMSPAPDRCWRGAEARHYLTESPISSTSIDSSGSIRSTGGDVVTTTATLAHALWYRSEPPPHRFRMDVQISEPARLVAIEADALAAGWEVVELSPVRRQQLISYSISDDAVGGGTIAGELVDQLRGARASVAFVSPELNLECHVGGQPLKVVASAVGDPVSFDSRLLAGSWLECDEPRAVVLPASILEAILPGTRLGDCVGRTIPLAFRREPAEVLQLSCYIAGITPGTDAYIGLDDALGIQGWLSGRQDFSESTGAFVDPVQESVELGTARATVATTDIEGLRALLRELEPQGFRVHHRLGELERTTSLGNTIVLLALALAVSAVLAGFVTTWITTNVYMRAKRREVGIMRSLGLGPRGIARIFGIQGAVVGSVGFLLALVLGLAIEPSLTAVLAATLDSDASKILPERLFSLGSLSIHGLSWVASAGLCMAGSYYVAWRSARAPISESLRNQE